MRAKASFSLLEVCVICCLLSFGMWITPIGNSQAAVPDSINYQGKLTRAGGGPLTGDYDLTFSIYPDDLGSPADWTETQLQVQVEQGIFSVLLGSVNPIQASLFDGSVKYLGIKVEDDPEMTPLKPMVTTSYAFHSQEADTAEYARSAPLVPDDDWTIDGNNIYREQGNVGIGMMAPAEKLSVAGTIESTSGGFKFPDGSVQTTSASVGGISIITGSANHNDLITPPGGYSVAQCKCIVSPRSFGPMGSSGEGYSHWCYVTEESGGWRVYARSRNTVYGHWLDDSVNYMVIGTK